MRLAHCLPLMLVLALGCSTKAPRIDSLEWVPIELATPAPERRLGEALLLTVTAAEFSGHTARRMVRQGEMEFWLRSGNGDVTRLWPVAPPTALKDGPAEPGLPTSRTFVFTKYPLVPGPAELTATFRDEGADGAPAVWCNRVSVMLTGPVAMERDQAGMITQDTALRLASAHLGDAAQTPLHAELVDSPFGLKDWLVVLGEGDTGQTAVLLNPYLGSVRRSWPVSQPTPN